MKKSLPFLLVFAVFLLSFIACSQEDKNKITGNVSQAVEVQTSTPAETMPEVEKETVEQSGSLSNTDYEIFELRFSTFVVTTGNPTFTTLNNLNFSLSIGIKNKISGFYCYIPISFAAWSFISDNTAVTKNGNSGFTTGISFYNNKDANVSVNISYKGLSKTFTFILKSSVQQTFDEEIIQSFTHDAKLLHVIRYNPSNPLDPRNITGNLNSELYSIFNRTTEVSYDYINPEMDILRKRADGSYSVYMLSASVPVSEFNLRATLNGTNTSILSYEIRYGYSLDFPYIYLTLISSGPGDVYIYGSYKGLPETVIGYAKLN